MGESSLPPEILQKASLRGNEYAWPLNDVPEAITVARNCGLATLSGNFQFRIPEGTCDLYWLTVESAPRAEGEPWAEYVARSAEEVLTQFRKLQASSDFTTEGNSFGILSVKQSNGVSLDEFLCLVLYFEKEAAS